MADGNEIKAQKQSKFWAFKIFDAIPLPYWLTCIIYAALVCGAMIAALLFFEADLSREIYIRSLILVPFLAAYMLALCYVASASARTMIKQLGPILLPHAPVNKFNSESTRLDRKNIWMWTIIFQLISLVSQWFGIERESAGEWVVFWSRQYLFLHYTFYVFLYVKILTIRRFTFRWVDVSIYQIPALYPIGRLGLRLTLLIGLGAAFVGAVQILMGAQLGVMIMSLIMASPGYFLIASIFIMPAQPIRQRIKTQKSLELARIQNAITSNSSIEVLGQEISGIDLLDYRDRVVDLTEWPLDTRTIRSFSAVLLLPILSWGIASFLNFGLANLQ